MTDSVQGSSWRARLPWPLRLVLTTALCSATYLLGWTFHHPKHQPWWEAAVTGAILGVVLFSVLPVITRWQGGPDAARAARQAIRRQRIPDDGDPTVLRTGLEGFLRANLRLRWWFYGSGAALVILVIAVAAVRAQPALLVVAVVTVVLVGAYFLFLRSRLRRVDVLLAELDRRERSGAAADDH